MTDLTGQQFGVYRVIHPLGRGGYGATYLGEHTHLKNQVVIKTLPAETDERETQNFINQARFSKQARLLAKASHPNIVNILDFGEQSGTYFIVTEYAPGGSLRQRHPRGTRVPLNTVVSYIKQVASALQYAHDQGIVHRDVKPEHMLVGRNGEILLGGFDLAVAIHAINDSGTGDLVGTPLYMAPEQILATTPRPASDQYALGVVIYEWLSGDVPFHGTPLEIAAQHLRTPPPPLRTKVPEIPREVEEVVMIALNKDPQKRFGSVQAFANAFEQASRVGFANPFEQTGPGGQKAGSASPGNRPNSAGGALSKDATAISPGSRREETSTPQVQQGQQAYPVTPALPRETPGYPVTPPLPGSQSGIRTPESAEQWGQQYPTTPSASGQGTYPSTPPPSVAPRPAKSSRGPLSSVFSQAGDALERLFSNRGKQREQGTQEPQVSLYAIARAALEEDNRAVVGKVYTAQVGIARNVPERFEGVPFDVPVRDMTRPLWFDIVIHASENIELLEDWHKRLSYNLRDASAQLVVFPFRLRAPGGGSLAITFYHERRWLQTVRLEFEGVQTSTLTNAGSGG